MSYELRRWLRAIAHGMTFVGLVTAILPTALSAEEKDPIAVIELGGAGAWDVRGGSSFGPSAAIEFEPIKNYLEIEAGIAPLFDRSGHAEWDFDVVIRRLFNLSKQVEFEPGIGPTWTSSGQLGAQASFEFMIWPWQERKFGWFVDPSYSVSFARGHEQSVGLTVGILIGIFP